MFEFLKDTVLCSTDGCTGDRDPRYERRRPGEVISSQGGPRSSYDPLGEGTPPQPSWSRTGTPIGTPPLSRQGTPIRSRPFNQAPPPRSGSPLGGRSPRMSFRATRQLRKSYSNEVHDVLGDSFPCTGAASLDDTLPGRGLCVSMQRGLTRSSVQAGQGDEESFPKQLPQRQKEGRGMLVPANRYEACVEDPIDRCFERLLRQQDPSATAALLVRRYGAGEYEVDSSRISVGWRRLDSGQRDAYVFDKNGPSEPLGGYLRRAGDVALARAAARAALPVYSNKAGAPQVNGSFYRSDTGSFYGGHEVVPPGSFYSNYSRHSRPGPKDVRLEAMHIAGISNQPVVMPTSVSFVHAASSASSRQPSFVMPHHAAAHGSMNIPVAGAMQAPAFVSVRG